MPRILDDQACSACGRRLLIGERVALADSVPVDVVACPDCDRIRCRHCGRQTGRLLGPGPHRCDSCGLAPTLPS